MSSSLFWLIVLCVTASVFGLGAYLLFVKHYYWSGGRSNYKRRKKR